MKMNRSRFSGGDMNEFQVQQICTYDEDSHGDNTRPPSSF